MTIYDPNFIDPPLNLNTIYIYSVRKLLQKALEKSIPKFKGVLLDLGCGEMPYRQYILDHNPKIKKYLGVDVNFNKDHQTVKPDLYWDGQKIPSKNQSIDTLIATELFEHIPNVRQVLTEIARVLKPHGILYATVPFIWPLHETPFDEYRYTPYSLKRLLKESGFKKIEIYSLGQHHASLAQMLCIWTAHTHGTFDTPIKNKSFYIFEKLIFYLIKKLLQMDAKLSNSYQENTMAPGFYIYAQK